MQNENQAYKSKETAEEQTIDIKQIIFIFLRHWYLFVIFAVAALAVGFVVNRYSTRIYQTSGTVIIKDDRSGYDPTAIMTSSSYGNVQNLDNEIVVLTSYTLRERVVKKMGIEVSYMEKGRISNTELYKNSPFLVEFEHSVPQAVGLTYEISFLDDGDIRLHTVGEGLTKYDFILCQQTEYDPLATVDTIGIYKEGEWIDNGLIRSTKDN